ncbi:MAG: sulfatase [Acidobacteria bacterium]|nr:MAG: sulfatase [Acidobacteriota bacterium]
MRIETRRSFFGQCAGGLGMIALWQLLLQEGRAAVAGDRPLNLNPLEPRAPHFAPKAKNVIFLFMSGAPSQLDLFDPKPELQKWEGQPLPASMTKDLKLAFIKPTAEIWASPRIFRRHGQCGMEFSDLLPHIATCADEICLIRSMYTEQFNHHPGQLMMSCGSPLAGRPGMGAWITYGLGSESQSLPGFVVLSSGPSQAGSKQWSSGFLPSTYQGVPFRNVGDPVLYLSNPPGVDRKRQRARIDALRELNEQRYADTGDMEIAARIASYEMAFRMQAAAPELLDLSKEPASSLELYGVNKKPDASTHETEKDGGRFAVNCLLARRLVERGVRFVQVIHPTWDDHEELNKKLKSHCEMTDQPTAALLKDLKQRGLLETTLVVWGGEFGRTPMVEKSKIGDGDTRGRDHHPFAFSLWMAGGGIKGGQVFGKTDDLGLNVVQDKVHVHDLHATILYCLGLDHQRLTYRHQGRDFRLTDVAGRVVDKLLT